jgi:ATP-dependent exoDNAse (exonuclease V) beta subunit
MRHPVMQPAADAQKKGLCYRETPVTWRLSDRALIEGYVDLAYVVDDEVVVVEFKTDRELAGALETYRRQVQVYAAAVGSALGRRPRAVLMRV